MRTQTNTSMSIQQQHHQKPESDNYNEVLDNNRRRNLTSLNENMISQS